MDFNLDFAAINNKSNSSCIEIGDNLEDNNSSNDQGQNLNEFEDVRIAIYENQRISKEFDEDKLSRVESTKFSNVIDQYT